MGFSLGATVVVLVLETNWIDPVHFAMHGSATQARLQAVEAQRTHALERIGTRSQKGRVRLRAYGQA